jgi:hypothetical protein
MQRGAIPDYASPDPPRPVPWYVELRFTLIGAAVGVLATTLVVGIPLARLPDWPLPFLCPVTWRVIRMLSPGPPILLLFILMLFGFLEWLMWVC